MQNMPGSSFQDDFGPIEIELANGVKMPILGLGTSHNGGYSQSAVVYALNSCNYKLIDTAKRYGCEQLLRSAICESGIPREELFLTTKLWCTDYGSSSTRKAFFGSLKRLGLDYLDLYMLHWPLCHSACPNKQQTLEETWRSLELLHDEGYCRAIGVSNYNIDDLEQLLSTCTIVPHVNQVEFHPFQNPSVLLKYCKENKIQIEGYCPLGKGQILSEPAIIEVGKHCSRSPAQVLVRWSIQNNVVTIPKSTKTERVRMNSQVFDFKISEQDMDILNGLHDGRKFVDVSSIQDKIDKCLPDGYKLRMNSMEFHKLGYRNHS